MLRLAVTTHSFLLDVTFSQNFEVTHCRPVDAGYHFGLSRYQDYLTAYRGGKDVHNQTEPLLVTYRINSLSDAMIPADRRPLSAERWSDLHQINVTNDGAYIANTGRNQIAFLSNRDVNDDFYSFGGGTRDIHHVNSITFHNGQILALLHNKSRKESEIAVMNHTHLDGFTLLHTRSLWHIGCHNLFVAGNTLVYNASQAHKLVFVNLETNKIVNEIEFRGWHTKGLSVTPNYYIIGLSEHTLRDRRSISQGRLAIIDRKTWRVVGNVPLQVKGRAAGVGNINEVRCLSENEFAAGTAEGKPIDWGQTQLTRIQPLDNLLVALVLVSTCAAFTEHKTTPDKGLILSRNLA